jgi:glycosyltransferase involved in cell wall biosynthesis
MNSTYKLPKIYFWTSGAPSLFLTDLIKALSNLGLNVECKYLITTEEYRSAGSSWMRLQLRLRMYISYPVKLFIDMLFINDACIHVVTSNTFYAPFIANLLAKKNQRVINLIWDLYPDALIAAGLMDDRGIKERAIRLIVSKTIKWSDANIFIGSLLLDFARERYKFIPRAHVISVGASTDPFKENYPKLIESKINILYCGNIGRMHDVDTFLELVETKQYQIDALTQINFSFNCSGHKHKILRDRVANLKQSIAEKISIGPDLSDKDWIKKMSSSEVGLVTMSSGTERVVLPSKTFSCMAAGQAIIGICPIKSDLSLLITSHNCGWVVAPGDTKKLKSVLNEIANFPSILLEKRINSYKAGHNIYSEKILALKWIEVFKEVNKNIRHSNKMIP